MKAKASTSSNPDMAQSGEIRHRATRSLMGASILGSAIATAK
jgi:hypothetical protein